jgi:hypothetical protein
MGQQQLLLIVLGVIIVGISFVVGIQMFNANAANANIESVINDLMKLAAKAQQFYLKPESIGGGGQSFRNITIADLTTKPTNENGTYKISKKRRRRLVLIGEGKFDGDGDGKNCKVRAVVFPDSIAIKIRNR